MPFRDDSLQKAEITLYYDKDAQRLMPYLKVKAFNSDSGYDHGQEYYVKFKLPTGISDPLEGPYRVRIVHRSDGAFPFEQFKGDKQGTVALHQFTDL